MKRILLSLVVLLMLVGCSNKSVDQSIKDGLAVPLAMTHNHKKPLIDYYLPPSVGLKSSNEFSSLLLIKGYDVLMNLNIEHAVSETFEYDNEAVLDEGIFDFTYFGSYLNAENAPRQFKILIKNLEEDRSAVFVDNDDVQFVSVVNRLDLPYVIETLITIMRSVEVDTPKVVARYSNKDIKKTITIYSEFFERVPPESGTLEEMYGQLQPK